MKRLFRFTDLKRYVPLYLYAYIISLLVSIFIDYISFNQELNGVALVSYFWGNLAIFFVLTPINLFIVTFFNRKYKKRENINRIVFELLAAIISMNVVSQIINDLEIFGTISAWIPIEYIILNSAENIIIIILLELVYAFLKNKEDNIRIHKLQIENEKFKYNQLKSQINPHFLFNSLNILAAMVYKKKDYETGEYIEKLSDVYHYVLTKGENKVTTLKLEIEFISKYVEILKARFQEGLILDIDINSDCYNMTLPTMSLQLLVENCIKHNIVSKEHPLIINIYTEENFIIVSNNKNIREEKVISTGIGLNNLNKRYELIAKKSIEVIDNEDIYKVKIPLI